MGNHNVLITNTKGERRLQFLENTSKDECDKWLGEFGPAPIGWMYQTTNLNRKKRLHPEHVLVTGFSKDGVFIDQRKARHRTNHGWYTVRMAKNDMRKLGCSWFKQEKVWLDDPTAI